MNCAGATPGNGIQEPVRSCCRFLKCCANSLIRNDSRDKNTKRAWSSTLVSYQITRQENYILLGVILWQ